VHDDGTRLEEAIDAVDEALLLVLGQGGAGARHAGLEAPALGGSDERLEQLLPHVLLLLPEERLPLLIGHLLRRHLSLCVLSLEFRDARISPAMEMEICPYFLAFLNVHDSWREHRYLRMRVMSAQHHFYSISNSF
jgi:hypothetical protein